jgi:mannose-6-phosphate isomerase-like protein (cupin superfamily)
MAKVSRESARVDDHGVVEDRHEELDGYTVNFLTFREDIDATPLLRGLPGDHCTSPHWGYVIKGRVTYTIGDRVEVHEAGDAFYVPPGHLQKAEAGTEYVQFSPTEDLAVVSARMAANMQAMMQGA